MKTATISILVIFTIIMATVVAAQTPTPTTAPTNTPVPTSTPVPTPTTAPTATPTTAPTETPTTEPTSTPTTIPTETPTSTPTPTPTGTPKACPVYQMPVNVDQLGNPPFPDNHVFAKQPGVNKLYEQCCTVYGLGKPEITIARLNFPQFEDIVKKLLDQGGVTPNDGLTDVDAAGNSELKKLWAIAKAVKFKDGGAKDSGFKVFINPVAIDGATNNQWGSSFDNSESSVVAAETVHGDANTWAHEIGHAAGDLQHDDPGVDKSNLMWPHSTEQTGTKLTKEQCEKLIAGFQKIKGTKVIKSPGVVLTSGGSLVNKKFFFGTSQADDDEIDTDDGDLGTGSTLHLYAAGLLFDRRSDTPGEHVLEASFITDPITGTIPKTKYVLRLDTDNNPNTGPKGAEYKLKIKVRSPTDAVAKLINTATGETTILAVPIFTQLDEEGLFGVPPGTPDTVTFTSIAARIPLSLLESLSNPIGASAVAKMKNMKDNIPREKIASQPNPAPPITMDKDTGAIGTLVNIAGSEFTPSTNVRILFDSEDVATVTTDSGGNFVTTFTVPSRPDQRYSVDVIDDAGLFNVNGFLVQTP